MEKIMDYIKHGVEVIWNNLNTANGMLCIIAFFIAGGLISLPFYGLQIMFNYFSLAIPFLVFYVVFYASQLKRRN